MDRLITQHAIHHHMPEFEVWVTIENKPGISDPEGATILNDLVLKGTSIVSRIRTAKMLKFTVTSETEDAAKKSVSHICDEFRIYNPVVSRISLAVSQSPPRQASP